jgi:mRNA-degrading endonuclease RelE of RelBE toxin-antitoxin system
MDVRVEKRAAKYLSSLDATNRERIKAALKNLAKDPPEGDIKPIKGEKKGAYRVRVGGYRILYRERTDCLAVYSISSRGQAYKSNNLKRGGK